MMSVSHLFQVPRMAKIASKSHSKVRMVTILSVAYCDLEKILQIYGSAKIRVHFTEVKITSLQNQSAGEGRGVEWGGGDLGKTFSFYF